MINNTISITCDTKDYLNFEELTEFQGNLKKRDDEDIDKIVKSIKQYGFAFPFYIWKHDGVNHVLDGHGRYNALKKLDNLGFLIPPLPVVYVDCKDEKSARDLLLRLNSHYGKMDKDSVLEFIGDFDIDVSNFELPCGTIKFEPELEPIDFGDEETEKKSGNLGILVQCDSEEEMETTFSKLKQAGYKCRMTEL